MNFKRVNVMLGGKEKRAMVLGCRGQPKKSCALAYATVLKRNLGTKFCAAVISDPPSAQGMANIFISFCDKNFLFAMVTNKYFCP